MIGKYMWTVDVVGSKQFVYTKRHIWPLFLSYVISYSLQRKLLSIESTYCAYKSIVL
jgi:hypothetical protein